jgi:hypothetical protein
MSVNLLGPYQTSDIFQYAVLNGNVDAASKNIFHLAQVCKTYNEWSKHSDIWITLSKREGIPLVKGYHENQKRNLKEDFRVLRLITISSKIISQFFGTVIGDVPPISQYWFDKLNQNDPFGSEVSFEAQALYRKNYIFIVDPSYIERYVDKETPLDLDENGNLVEVNADAVVSKQLKIPFSIRNLYVLCKYPLKGKDYRPVFEENCLNTISCTLTAFPEQTGVYIMRKLTISHSNYIGIPFSEQEARVKSKKFTIIPTRIRALMNAIDILKYGNCVDNASFWSLFQTGSVYARTAYMSKLDHTIIPLDIGRFQHNAFGQYGLRIQVGISTHESIGVVPGHSAEIPAQEMVSRENHSYSCTCLIS